MHVIIVIMDARPPEPACHNLASAQLSRWWQEVAAAVRAGNTPRACRVLRWIAAVCPTDPDVRRWQRHLVSQPLPSDPATDSAKPTRSASVRMAGTGVRIAGIVFGVAVALVMSLLLPRQFGRAELGSSVYQGSLTATPPAAAEPTATPVSLITSPCVEIPQPGEPLAAVVNGQGISLQRLDRAVAHLLAELVDGVDAPSAEAQADAAYLEQLVLDQLITDTVVQQAAASAGIHVTLEDIQAYLDREVGSSEAQAQLREQLEAKGQTWEEFQRQVCQDLVRVSLLEKVTQEISPTLEMVSARQIVVATQQDAQLALARLAAGDDFALVAQELSIDAATREQGGDLGWFPAGLGLLPPEIEQAAFSGTPGLVQGPFLIDGWYYLLQTTDRQADRPVDAGTRRALREAKFDRWLADQLAVADVEVLVEPYAVPQASSTPGVTPVTGAELPIPPWLILVVFGLALVILGAVLGLYDQLLARLPAGRVRR